MAKMIDDIVGKCRFLLRYRSFSSGSEESGTSEDEDEVNLISLSLSLSIFFSIFLLSSLSLLLSRYWNHSITLPITIKFLSFHRFATTRTLTSHQGDRRPVAKLSMLLYRSLSLSLFSLSVDY